MAELPLALQMYTVRDHSAEDFAGTVRATAEMGYQGVELAGTGGLGAAEMNRLLDDCGLTRCGSHVGLQALETDLQREIDYNLAIGNPWVVVPWLPEDLRGDAAGWRAMGERLAGLGEQLQAVGLQLCYHNHAFEFDVRDGDDYGFDLLYASAPAELLQCEIDTYWVKYAGQDPAAYVARYQDRAPLIHLKDMTAGPEPTFAEVGTGTMDFPAIFAAAEGGIAAAWIVEQDRCAGDSLAAARTSLGNLKRMLGR